MVNRNLIRGLDLNEEEWEQELAQALEGSRPDEIDWGGGEWRSTRSSKAACSASKATSCWSTSATRAKA